MEKPWCKYGDHGITTLRDFLRFFVLLWGIVVSGSLACEMVYPGGLEIPSRAKIGSVVLLPGMRLLESFRFFRPGGVPIGTSFLISDREMARV